jgi:hypothetical protein
MFLMKLIYVEKYINEGLSGYYMENLAVDHNG